MTRWIPLLAVLLLGCPRTVPPTTSGEVADDRPAWLGLDRADVERHRRTIERKLAVLSTLEGPEAAASQRRLEAALVLLQDLDASPDLAPRDRERAALKAFAGYLDAMLHGEPAPAAPAGAEEPSGLLVRAVERARRGDFAGALELGIAARDDLYAAKADSVSLLRLLGEWAMEADQLELALDLLGDARRLAAGLRGQDEALAALMDEAREALLGPAAAALERGREAREAGDLAGAADAFREAMEAEDTDGSAPREAQAELLALVSAAADRSAELLQRVDVLLAGAGPYDAAGALLQEVEALPAEAVDDAELLRLRAWHRSLTSEQGRAQADADRAALDARLQEARDRVAQGAYREAVTAYRRLEGTPLQGQARQESRTAIDELVRQERERAGRLFVSARRQQGEARALALSEVRALLQGLLDEFPGSSYADRVAENLAAVDRELGK